MITNYLPYIFGSISLLGGIYILVLSFKIYTPKHKSDEAKVKYENWLANNGKYQKIIAVFLIINGGYDIIVNDTDRYRIVKNESQWTDEIKKELTLDCINGAKMLNKKYPELARKSCECSTIKITEYFTYNEYIANMDNDNKKKKFEIIKPVIKECLDEMKAEYDILEKDNSK